MEGICKDGETKKNRYSPETLATVDQLFQENNSSSLPLTILAGLLGLRGIFLIINSFKNGPGAGGTPASGANSSRASTPNSGHGGTYFSFDPSISAWNSYTAYCSPTGPYVRGEGYRQWDMSSIQEKSFSWSIRFPLKSEHTAAAALNLGLAVLLTIAATPLLIAAAA